MADGLGLRVILSLLLVGITSASSTRVVALERDGERWRRTEVPSTLPPGRISVLDVEGSGSFTSVPALVAQLPQPPQAARERPDVQPAVVVLRLHGHLRTNLTFTKALQTYAEKMEHSDGALIVCGLQPAAITQLRSAGLPESVTLVAQGAELEGSLEQAYAMAADWLARSSDPQP